MHYTNQNSMGAIVLWWLVLEGLGLIVFPLLFPLFARSSSHGYAFGKIAALLLLTYVSWLSGYVIPMSIALNGTLVLMILGGVAAGWMQREALRTWLKEGGWEAVLRTDVLWTIGFL